MREFRNTVSFWVVLYRAIQEIQQKQAVLNVDTQTAEALPMPSDLKDPEAAALRVRGELDGDFEDSPDHSKNTSRVDP